MGLKENLFAFYYVILLQGVLAGIVAGGAQFGIAYGMYKHSQYQVTLWKFPNTFSGDCALSLFIQVGVTWVSQELIVGWDCYRTNNELVRLPEFLLVEKPRNWFSFLYFEVNRGLIYKDYETKPTLKKYLAQNFRPYLPKKNKFINFCAWIFSKAIRGLIFSVPLFLIVWPVTMGIMAGIGHKIDSDDYYFNNFPTPQSAKLIYGFVIGLITAPIATIVIVLRNHFYIDNIENSDCFKNYIVTVDLGEKRKMEDKDLEKYYSKSNTSIDTTDSSIEEQIPQELPNQEQNVPVVA